MEYREIKKKNGSLLVFCNFEELLKEFYGVGSMEEVEPFANSNGQYIIHCPFCRDEGHTKHKLYIKTDLTVGHCFVCTRAYVNVTDSVDTKVKLPDFFNQGYKPLEVVPLTDPEWCLSSMWSEFDSFDQVGYNYLMGRHGFMDTMWKLLDFKFMNGNIVIPFKYHGEVFYYQIRFSGTSKIKYFFPPISAKPPYIIEHGENKKFIICEGVFDAISLLIQAPSYTPFAVLGSSISDYQIQFLREYVPEEILIYLDETKLSNGIANKLRSVIDYCPIKIIRSNGEDPEEKMKRLLKCGSNLQWIG